MAEIGTISREKDTQGGRKETCPQTRQSRKYEVVRNKSFCQDIIQKQKSQVEQDADSGSEVDDPGVRLCLLPSQRLSKSGIPNSRSMIQKSLKHWVPLHGVRKDNNTRAELSLSLKSTCDYTTGIPQNPMEAFGHGL